MCASRAALAARRRAPPARLQGLEVRFCAGTTAPSRAITQGGKAAGRFGSGPDRDGGAVVAPPPPPQLDAQVVGACRNLFDAVGPVTGRAVPTCVSTSCPVAHGRTRLLLTSRRPGRTRWRWAARRLARLCGLQHADPDRLPARIAHGKRLRFDFDGDRSCAPRMH